MNALTPERFRRDTLSLAEHSDARPRAPAAPQARAAAGAGLPLHAATALTGGGAQALIDLDGKIYTLRITRAGKLILTK